MRENMESQGTLNSQNNFIKEEQIWRSLTSQFQNLLQSYSNQNNIVLPQRQTHTIMEENRKPKIEPMYIWSNNFQ